MFLCSKTLYKSCGKIQGTPSPESAVRQVSAAGTIGETIGIESEEVEDPVVVKDLFSFLFRQQDCPLTDVFLNNIVRGRILSYICPSWDV